MAYLVDIPESANEYGTGKLFAVRKESIHIEHIFAEIFTRKSVDIVFMLDAIDIYLIEYMSVMMNRLRTIDHFPRDSTPVPDDFLKLHPKHFFDFKNSFVGFNKVTILDFDGTITNNKFHSLYQRINNEDNVIILTENPQVTNERFEKLGLSIPNNIVVYKGKKQKIKQLIELSKTYNYCFFIDNEIEYLKYGWIFGVRTYQWTGKEIKYFTMKTK